MAVCTCPQGIIRSDCDHHQAAALRVLDQLNRTPRPVSIDTTPYRAGGYTPKGVA